MLDLIDDLIRKQSSPPQSGGGCAVSCTPLNPGFLFTLARDIHTFTMGADAAERLVIWGPAEMGAAATLVSIAIWRVRAIAGRNQVGLLAHPTTAAAN